MDLETLKKENEELKKTIADLQNQNAYLASELSRVRQQYYDTQERASRRARDDYDHVPYYDDDYGR